VDRLKETRFAITVDDTVESLAENLGVSAELIATARAEKEAELLGKGLPAAGIARIGKKRPPQISIWFPKDAYGHFVDEAKLMGRDAGSLLRAIVYTLLTGPDNPRWMGRGWIYDGRREHLKRYQERRWPWVVHLSVTVGAHVALADRAERLHTTKTALIRGAVIDYLEGRMPSVKFVELSEMWEDPKRYWTGELIEQAQYKGHEGTG